MPGTLNHSKTAKIFWTGGWDSTFQLLQLLTVHKVSVAPFYLIDEGRRSTTAELLTRRRIQSYLQNHMPDASKLLSPTRYFAVGDIPPDPYVTEAYEHLRDRSLLGPQYDWLARFCKQNGISNLQLSLAKVESGRAYPLLHKMVEEFNCDGMKTFKMRSEFSDTDEYTLFKYYSFPVFHLTKPEMAEISVKQGLDEIMNMTWFCHRPQKGMQPCGICNPCLNVIDEGMGWRIPARRRILSPFAYSIIRPSRNLAKRFLKVPQE